MSDSVHAILTITEMIMFYFHDNTINKKHGCTLRPYKLSYITEQ